MSGWQKRGARASASFAAGDPVNLGAYAAWRADVTATSTTFDWTDRTGHGHTLRQSIAGSKPTIVTASEANAQLALRFDGVDDYLDSVDAASSWKFLIDGTGVALWSAWVVRSVTTTQQVFSCYTSGANTGAQFGQQSATFAQSIMNNAGSFVTNATLPSALLLNEPTSALFQYLEGRAPNEYELRFGRHAFGLGNSAVAPGTNNPPATLRVGARANGSNFLLADLLEAAVWTAPLSTESQVALAQYTLDRYQAT